MAGARLHLIGRRPPDLTAPVWRAVATQLATLAQHLEVRARAEQWRSLVPALRDRPSDVVIDHPGLPGAGAEADRAVRAPAARDHVWVKVSAPYRSPRGAAAGTLARLADEVGTAWLLWGSDRPWTRHEQGRSYRACLDWITAHLDAQACRALLGGNAARLLRWTPRRGRPG
ncbi:amidohydrolase family protein [Streptomyces sp. NBC_01456]|uniref:amidohydrolase family protein n=1 Tax=unclassified Streptomyces TaxID=2593676 RepID=UPI002E3131BA|nr:MULTISPECIES: amidohydrolase family protein [unclassified Streptomyces]